MKNLLSSVDKTTITQAIGKELLASMLYKDIANKLQRLGYFGAQKYFLSESADELEHYQKWVNFVNDLGDVAQVPAIPAMNNQVTTLRDAFELSYKAEKELGDFYNKFKDDTDDCYVENCLIEFIEIQRESVGKVGDFLARLDICGSDRAALLVFDNELGK